MECTGSVYELLVGHRLPVGMLQYIMYEVNGLYALTIMHNSACGAQRLQLPYMYFMLQSARANSSFLPLVSVGNSVRTVPHVPSDFTKRAG